MELPMIKSTILLALAAATSLPSTANAGKMLDAEYTSALCDAWNNTSLPTNLGRKGSEWIDSAGSKGTQKMVISRRDCSGWQKVSLTITADANGNASCTTGGAHDGSDYQWKFEPTTEQWADFTDGFGVFDMPGIMTGFVGPYPTAAANIANFEVFFAAAGKTALDMKADWACNGADAGDVNEAIEDIDMDDMRKILK